MMQQQLYFHQASELSEQQPATLPYQDLDQFMAHVQRRALIMAETATGSREEGLDLVQDSMLAFVRRYRRKPAAQWAPLFHRTLQNRIRDWYRKTAVKNRCLGWLGRSNEESDGDPFQEVQDPNHRTPDQLLGLEHSGKTIIAALHALPLRQQQAFLLRIWEGFDVATTAGIMGCSRGSVKTHLSRARKSLQLSLEDHYR